MEEPLLGKRTFLELLNERKEVNLYRLPKVHPNPMLILNLHKWPEVYTVNRVLYSSELKLDYKNTTPNIVVFRGRFAMESTPFTLILWPSKELVGEGVLFVNEDPGRSVGIFT